LQTMESSDKQLLARYRNGQVEAMEELVEKYRRPLFGYIIKMTEGRGEADEIFQQVWLKVINSIGTYRHKNFLGWLIRIARNSIIDNARRRRPEVSLDAEHGNGLSLLQTIPGKEPGPLHSLEANDLRERIDDAVDLLPEQQKETFLMRVQADLPFKEIARIHGVSINTALARMQYALEKLRTFLKDEYMQVGGQIGEAKQ
jgi:RNA polymerase sigma factor (sigma-70 family)